MPPILVFRYKYSVVESTQELAKVVVKPEKVPSGTVKTIKLKMQQRAGCETDRYKNKGRAG